MYEEVMKSMSNFYKTNSALWQIGEANVREERRNVL